MVHRRAALLHADFHLLLGLDHVSVPVDLSGMVETIVRDKAGDVTGTWDTEIISTSLTGRPADAMQFGDQIEATVNSHSHPPAVSWANKSRSYLVLSTNDNSWITIAAFRLGINAK
ncbi:hypothetical protein LCGC14_1557280 [marine sediment metagenome]|uniref:Uncharacterized protein n=1 Tax=marine sediment metagenome TaxID=412755 RepID=A0A0F9J9K5_9ZZZZ